MEGGCPESAELIGRTCDICQVECNERVCPTCTQVLDSLDFKQQHLDYGESLFPVICSLQTWSREIPTWNIIDGLLNLLKPSVRRCNRSHNSRRGPFIVFEGVDGAGKTFHMDVVQEFLVNIQYPVHKLVFPNGQTKLGRFLKTCMREARHLDVWTQHVLFSIHRWEFMSWMTDILEKGEAILCERYVWSGIVYSCALATGVDIRTFMCTDMGLMAPDMVIYVDTPPEAVRARPQMSALFSDIEFQNQLYDLYQEVSIWDDIRVVRHKTSDNKWESRQRLMAVIRGDPLWKMANRPWNYLWENSGRCSMCNIRFDAQEECQRCMECLNTVHQCCLFQDQTYERIPVCSACQQAASSTDPPPPLPPPETSPPDEGEVELQLGDVGGETELVTEDYFAEKLRESGSTPCKLHGMDHLSRDPECEFCKKALGPMYRHLNHKYGMQIADHTPTLSFDFSGPLPIAVTGAKILMVFVWRLQDIRLLWAFALVHRTKENVLSCLQSVIADLNTLTGGSKPPVTRVHSDQAKEFLSQPVMEWLKEKGIRQTFTSTYDSQANGVAERWINLIKTKSTALLASRYMPTPFWCYAVAWVTRCYNIKVLGQKPRKNLPDFGQLLLVRVNRENKLQERGSLGIMAGTYPEIANGVIVLSIHNNTVHESYTAHVAPATFSDKDRWFIKRDTKDPNKIVYVNDKGEIAWEAPKPHLPTVEQKLPLKYHPHYAALQRAVDGWAWYTSNVGQLLPHFEDIEPEDEKEPMPAIGGARFYTWNEISCEFLNPLAKEREEAKELPSLVQIVPEAGIELPPAPSGQPPKRKIEGSIALPQPLAEEVQRYAEEQDKSLTLLDEEYQRDPEENAQTLEEANIFPSSGGGGTFFRR